MPALSGVTAGVRAVLKEAEEIIDWLKTVRDPATLAAVSGVARSTIYGLREGRRLPNLTTLEKLSAARKAGPPPVAPPQPAW